MYVILPYRLINYVKSIQALNRHEENMYEKG